MTALEQYDACIDQQRAGNMLKAVEMLQKLTDDFPNFSLAYNALAAFYKKENNLESAISYMEKYCALEPDDAFGFSVLSAYCIASGQRERAEESLAKANELRFKAFSPNV